MFVSKGSVIMENEKCFTMKLFFYCRLKMGKTLGEGAFGVVIMADAQSINGKNGATTVAVKMLKGKIVQFHLVTAKFYSYYIILKL